MTDTTVLTTPCVVWAGYREPGGYGRVSRRAHLVGGSRLAHRVAWIEANGPIPKGMLVLHHCDNPPCVNVEHLFLGTHADNTRDRIAKGRPLGGGFRRGTRGKKLTAERAAAIRALAGTGSQESIAARFGVTRTMVSRIIRNLAW